MFIVDAQELLVKSSLHSSVNKYLLSNHSVSGTVVFAHIFNKTDMIFFLIKLIF